MIRCMFCDRMNPPGATRCLDCGAELPAATDTAPQPVDDQLMDLIRSGKKIEAIKEYRERTGAGLKEAKDAVEALERGGSIVTRSANERATDQEIVDLLQSGEKIGAIKLYRERTGAGLKEAKDAVESLERSESLTKPEVAGRDLEQQIVDLLQAGKKIEAIKLFRDKTGRGLAESKQAVEALASQHGIQSQGSGCAGALLSLLVITSILAYWIR